MTHPPAAIATVPLATLQLDIPWRLAEVAGSLVYNKCVVDKAVADYGAAMFAGDLHDGGYGIAEPWSFLHRVLPFMQWSEPVGESFKALIPTTNALGCSWKWSAGSLEAEEAERRAKLLSDAEAFANGAVNHAHYFWVKPLGLIAPIEGKNRVDFLRSRGTEFIPADVVEYSYPEPQRLKLYHVKENRLEQIWAVLDGRWVERLHHPSWSVPLLEAFGVETCSWPSTLPPIKCVHVAFMEQPARRPQAVRTSAVDLHAVDKTLARELEPIVASLIEIQGLKVDRRLWVASAAGAIAGFAVLGLTPETWVDTRLAAAMVFGGACVLGSFPVFRWITVPRRLLKN